uniref:Uncharacterized protein n=1 Tax=Meloidogyne javanica TaxID=6303 RepID=A0A915LHJ5_MELJA
MATLTASQATYFSDGSSTNPNVGEVRPKKRSRINGLTRLPLKRITRSQLTKQHTTAEKVPSDKSTTTVHSSQQGGTHQTVPKRGAPRGKPLSKPTSSRCKPKASTKTTKETEIAKEELDEVKLFGSINLSGEDIKLKNDCEAIEEHKEENLEVKDEIKEYFSQFLPLSRLININPLMVKHLYENEIKNNEGNVDDKLKKIK